MRGGILRARPVLVALLAASVACGGVPEPARPILSSVDASLDAEGAMYPTRSSSYVVWPRVETMRTNRGKVAPQRSDFQH